MVDLPQKKVGIVACSGEELPEGTITRLAALQVLEQLRPTETVTICLPLFLAGGEGDRAFARFYPTIAVDGCSLRCAARATEAYSSTPAATLVVEELIVEEGLKSPHGLRKLDQAGLQAVEVTATRMVELVDELLSKRWNRRAGEVEKPDLIQISDVVETIEPVVATCSCGSGIPVQKVLVAGEIVTLVGLPLLFQQFYQDGKQPSQVCVDELLMQVAVYNPLPPGTEADYKEMLAQEYAVSCQSQGSNP
jgi:uncharacterized metal-binding protein